MSNEMVSIIMPAYNAELYIEEAVRSVLAQDHINWELIIVNDGSTDRTGEIIRTISDPRIRLFEQTNQGIGSARNTGMRHAEGEYLVTLDSDDILPPKSLSSRLAVLHADPSLSFADGAVSIMDRTMTNVLQEYRPRFTGEPLRELVRITTRCFVGCSWMIRIDKRMKLEFDTNVTHGEDLLFYISLAKGRKYAYTNEKVLLYRRTGHSTMSDMEGLVRSYDHLYKWMLLYPDIVPPAEAAYFKNRIKRIAIGSYWHGGHKLKALLYFLGLRRPSSYPPARS